MKVPFARSLRLLRPVSERVARATGVDISGEMIDRAVRALADRPNVRLPRTEGDLPGTSLGSAELDRKLRPPRFTSSSLSA